MNSKYSSKLLDNAVEELTSLQGIGRSSALRIALDILSWDKGKVKTLTEAIDNFRNDIYMCKECNNLADNDTCDICLSGDRDYTLICVVENIKDVISIENTMQYKGRYVVLGTLISPMYGIGPSEIPIDLLKRKAGDEMIKEIIFALPTTVDGDTTAFYIHRQIKREGLLISTIARGVSAGEHLEFVDEVTLGKSILQRRPL